MKKFLLAFALVLLIPAVSFAENYKSMRSLFSTKDNKGGIGTVFIIENHIITAGHVCDSWLKQSNSLIHLQIVDGFGQFQTIGKVVPMRYIYNDNFDLCELFLIEGNLSEIEVLKLATIPPAVGQKVQIIGYPHGMFYSIEDGYLGSAYSYSQDTVSCWTKPGNSGSPVFNKEGRVIGVLIAGIPGIEHSSIIINWFSLKKFLGE